MEKVMMTIVLVHGAFSDGSSWDKVVPLLQAKGFHVVAVQNPLTSLADDVASVRRVIDAQKGPVVLVGHSWAGTVITEAGTDDKVAALVYVAAFAPDAGETSGDLGKNLPPAQTRVLAATQGPIFGKSFGEAVNNAAWKTKPSWYIVAEKDRMIQPDLERAMAKKINAKVTSLPTSHVPMQSRPKDVAAVIAAAAANGN